LVVFVVTGASIEAARAPAAPGEIEEGIQRLRFHLAKHERPELVAEDLVLRATRENLARLGELLLGPVADHVEGTRLVIGAHDRLHGVPFHAIPWQDGWLGEHFEIVYVPSGAVFARCAARGAAATGPTGVFAVPGKDVPHVEEEARAVASLLGTDHLHLGPNATLDTLRREAADARILHIATHGMFRRASPALSALQLGDGWVSHHDLETLRIDAELVVLSTCESGVAARGLLQAGARALLCSQWRVRDEVASAFMHAFYGALRDGLAAAAAHRRAMDTIRASHPHPYYWAPFFLLGRPASLPPAPIPFSPGNQR
ncbi:MAG: CHAT domain-containing protein, partial [Planctomycetota bacterium]|nr:CHAT domain-containing protein [Planctomycetota bacterium]